MSGYREYRSYSPTYDTEVVRLSMVDEHNAEFFAIIEDGGQGYIERRDAALQSIMSAMRSGREPGEVTV